MDYQELIYEKKDGFAVLTINRPDALNALNPRAKKELEDIIDDIETDDTIAGLIITGNGRAFCAGDDIGKSKPTPQEAIVLEKKTEELFCRIENMCKPVIAAVNGYALGGGCELTLACDIVIAAKKAKFGLPELKLGAVPGFGGTQRLPRRIGASFAKELMFTGRFITADEAYQLRLVNRVVEGEELMEAAVSCMKEILQRAPQAVSACKYLVNRGLQTDIDTALKYEMKAVEILLNSEDFVEGTAAFNEKREPVFKGRRTDWAELSEAAE